MVGNGVQVHYGGLVSDAAGTEWREIEVASTNPPGALVRWRHGEVIVGEAIAGETILIVDQLLNHAVVTIIPPNNVD